MVLFFHDSILAHPTFSSSTNNFAHAQTLSRIGSLSGRMNIGRVNIEFFLGWKKMKQRSRLFTNDIMKISTSIYLYGFLNQSLGLILGNIFFSKITACIPLSLMPTIDILWQFKFTGLGLWCLTPLSTIIKLY